MERRGIAKVAGGRGPSDYRAEGENVRKVIAAIIVTLIVLHQDFWWWDDHHPLVFGFIPIGLAWHAGISLAAVLTAFLAVKFCWPAEVEEIDSAADALRRSPH